MLRVADHFGWVVGGVVGGFVGLSLVAGLMAVLMKYRYRVYCDVCSSWGNEKLIDLSNDVSGDVDPLDLG